VPAFISRSGCSIQSFGGKSRGRIELIEKGSRVRFGKIVWVVPQKGSVRIFLTNAFKGRMT
jgi:hypothetical protein